MPAQVAWFREAAALERHLAGLVRSGPAMADGLNTAESFERTAERLELEHGGQSWPD